MVATTSIIPLTNGVGVERWLEVTKGWRIYSFVLGSPLVNLTEGKSSEATEKEHIFTKADNDYIVV